MSPAITTVILAGGRGMRMGGGKGLRILRGRPLIAWVLDAIRGQSDEILLSANDARAEYAQFCCPVIADLTPGWAGPLAGLQAALGCARNEWVASVPCDAPFLPHDLIARLWGAVGNAEAAVAVAEGRRQPAIALYHRGVSPKLDAYLASDERKASGWLDTLRVNEAVFDDAAGFININSAEELAAANQS